MEHMGFGFLLGSNYKFGPQQGYAKTKGASPDFCYVLPYLFTLPPTIMALGDPFKRRFIFRIPPSHVGREGMKPPANFPAGIRQPMSRRVAPGGAAGRGCCAHPPGPLGAGTPGFGRNQAMWLKMKELGLHRCWYPCFHLPGQAILGIPVF